MKIVEMDKTKGMVEVCRNVIGLVKWEFVYMAKVRTFTNSSDEPEPICEPLGDPNSLHRDVNTWTIKVGSTADEKQEYECRIEWKQQGEAIQIWSRKGDVTPDDPTDFITDNATLLAK